MLSGGGRVAEGDGLISRRTRKGLVGSNPIPPASLFMLKHHFYTSAYRLISTTYHNPKNIFLWDVYWIGYTWHIKPNFFECFISCGSGR